MNSGRSNTNYHPFRFIDQMEPNKHTILLYDNQRYAYWVIARYFLNGLKSGESCIFFTSEEPEIIEERLSSEGIDVGLFKQRSSLRIYSIEKSDDTKNDALSTLRHIKKDATDGMKPPYRFAGRTIIETETHEVMKLGLVLEKVGHEHFNDFNCSQMCFYDISKIEPSRRQEWIKSLLENHHNVIFATKPDKAVAFETVLLEDVE